MNKNKQFDRGVLAGGEKEIFIGRTEQHFVNRVVMVTTTNNNTIKTNFSFFFKLLCSRKSQIPIVLSSLPERSRLLTALLATDVIVFR